MIRRRILLAGLALLLASEVLAADSAPENQPVRGAIVELSGDAPPAGDPAKVRVRGEALAALLAAGDAWHLSAGGAPLAAELVEPQPPASAQPIPLTLLRQSDPADATLSAVLDRGADPAPLDHLRLYFAGLSVLGLVDTAASADDQEYSPCAEPQVVWQSIQGGTVSRLTDLSLNPGAARYLRLRIPAASGVQLERAEGWLAPEDPRTLYEVPATLGAMRDGTDPGEHLWPLEFEDNAVALAKLKVVADAPGQARRLDVVRLQQDGLHYTSAGEGLWADRLTAGGKQRSEKWLSVDDSGGGRPWALVVADEGMDALPVSGVQAYAAEYWLYFTMPDIGPLELWLSAAPATEPLTAEQRAAAVFAGEINLLNLSWTPPPPVQPGFGRDWLERLTPLLHSWGRLSAFALGGLVLIIIGMVLLRRPAPDGETD